MNRFEVIASGPTSRATHFSLAHSGPITAKRLAHIRQQLDLMAEWLAEDEFPNAAEVAEYQAVAAMALGPSQ